jgi:hypothetical protein
MPADITIVEVCDVLREALRRRGLFDGGLDRAARERALRDGLEEAAGSLGVKLTLADAVGSGHAVAAEGVPGLITVVPQDRVAGPRQGEVEDKVDPDLGVSWALA